MNYLIILSRFLAYCLCIVLVLQGAVALLVQQHQLANFKANNQGDVELICTGSQMKWISLSLTEELGSFVFVDAPDGAEELPLDSLCPAGAMADIQSNVALVSLAIQITFDAYRAFAARLNQRPYTLFAYQSAQSRAPPLV